MFIPTSVHQQEIDSAMSQAIGAFNSGHLQVAAEICKSILRRVPSSPEAHQLLAVIYLNQQLVPAACHHIQCSLQARPDHIPSLMIAGKVARADQNLLRAAVFFERAATLAPGDPEPAYLTGLVLLEQGKLADAVEVFGRLVQSYPSHALAWCSLGSTFQQGGLVAQAREALERSCGIDPLQVDAWFNLGLVRQDAKDFSGAATAFLTALELRPDYADAAVNLGIVLQENGTLDDAMLAYRKAYQLRPDTFGRIANALASSSTGRLWLDLNALRRLLAS